MIKFIDYDGEGQLPPPYRFTGVSITSFRLQSSLDAVQALCDRFLNICTAQARGFKYVAASQYVDLEIVTYPRMESQIPPFNVQGFSTQNEMYFRVLVARLDVADNMIIPSDLAWFFPYIFVDNPWSLISGREIIAFPKNLGKFLLQTGANPYPMEISAFVLDRYRPDTRLTMKPVIEIKSANRPANRPPAGTWPWGDMDFSGVSPALRTFLDSLTIFTVPALKSIGLKQFRDAETPANACYQALVQSEFTASNIRSNLLNAADISITQADSLPIVRAFRFTGPNVTPIWEYNIQCDMTFGNCKNVFVAA